MLVYQNIRSIISNTEELQEVFSNDTIYPPTLCFSGHHMSRDDVQFVGTEGLVSHEVLSRRVAFVYIFLMKYLLITLIFLNITKKKILEICAVQTVTVDKRMIAICV